MLDPVLAQHLWHERDRKLALKAELERRRNMGRRPTLSISRRCLVWGGDALIAIGYHLKRGATDAEGTATSLPATWTPLAHTGSLLVNRPYTLIYGQQLSAGAGRGAGTLIWSLTWLPANPTSARP